MEERSLLGNDRRRTRDNVVNGGYDDSKDSSSSSGGYDVELDAKRLEARSAGRRAGGE